MTPPSPRTDHPDTVSTSKENDLGSSELTVPTDGSVSEDGGSTGWFGEFKSIAKSTRDTIFPALDGIANLVHRSAMAVASEIAQLELDAEMDAERWRADNYREIQPVSKCEILPLPWVLNSNTTGTVDGDDDDAGVKYTENDDLKQQILDLSTIENTFLEPFSPDGSNEADTPFTLNEPRIQLIRTLLAMDARLANVHARISGRSKVKETIFWKNYFFHCNRLRLNFLLNTSELNEVDNDDDCSTVGSLIGAESVASSQDDSSYVRVRSVVASPPTSLNTLPETTSVGDMVMIGADGGELEMSPERKGTSSNIRN